MYILYKDWLILKVGTNKVITLDTFMVDRIFYYVPVSKNSNWKVVWDELLLSR